MKDAVLLVHGAVAAPAVVDGHRCLSTGQLDFEPARRASAFLLDPELSGDARAAIRAVRTHRAPAIYLKPVVLLAPANDREWQADAHWDRALHRDEPPPGLVAALGRVREKVAALEAARPGGDTQLSFRVLRFMATRGTEFEPVRSIRSRTGFVYPQIEALFQDPAADVAETLAALEHQRLLAGRFVARTHVCTHCASAFLNFQEVCPNCGSADLESDDLVHHFRCGHTAPLKDFHRGRALSCPKCDRALKQIGVDYDKPSMIHACHECGHSFQDPQVATTCYDCARTAPPDLQVIRTVKSYRITALGENAAIHGLDSLFLSVLGRELPLFDYESFGRVLELEASRIGRYGVSVSSLVVMSLPGLEDAYVELGRRAEEVFQELTRTIGAVLRKSDLLTARNESLFLALLTETSRENAERAIERLRDGVDRLLGSNLRHPPSLQAAIFPVEPKLDVDLAVEALVGGQVA